MPEDKKLSPWRCGPCHSGSDRCQTKGILHLPLPSSTLLTREIDDGDLQPEQVAKIARILGVPEQDVVSMNRRLAAPDHSLNATVRQDSEGEWQDWLVDETDSQEVTYADHEELTGRKALLSSALKTLNERERHILIERRLKDNPTTLEELSQQYGISRERVRQIEVRAFEKLQKAMKAQIAERRLQSQSAVAARQVSNRQTADH